MSTVLPWALSWRINSLIAAAPTGSTPDVGSSKMTRRGSCTSAWASPMRCSIPFEYVPTRRSAASVRPTQSITSATRGANFAPARPHMRA